MTVILKLEVKNYLERKEKMNNPFSLLGKTVLVTGASSGIGKGIAIECSKMGAKIIITGRNEERLSQTFNSLDCDGHQMIMADLDIQQDIDNLIEQMPCIDGLVLNAGMVIKSTVKFINKEKLDTIFRTNFFAPVLITQGLLKRKKLNKGGSVVLISSISVSYAAMANALYASSKGALNSFMKVLALEVAPNKIRVNAIQPSIIMGTNIFSANPMQSELFEWGDSCPLGRNGRTEDVAYATIYFLSDASSWVTGNAFTIDGGITLR